MDHESAIKYHYYYYYCKGGPNNNCRYDT